MSVHRMTDQEWLEQAALYTCGVLEMTPDHWLTLAVKAEADERPAIAADFLMQAEAEELARAREKAEARDWLSAQVEGAMSLMR